MQSVFHHMRINNNSTVLVVNTDGKTEKMELNKARVLARNLGLDLVEVDNNGVFKIMDRGKWLYEQKRAKKKSNRTAHTKEIKFGMKIEKHDFETKIRHIQKFVDKGFDVLITVEMRGRERKYPQAAITKLNEVLSLLDGSVRYDGIKRSGVSVNVLTHPVSKREIHGNKDSQKPNNQRAKDGDAIRGSNGQKND